MCRLPSVCALVLSYIDVTEIDFELNLAAWKLKHNWKKFRLPQFIGLSVRTSYSHTVGHTSDTQGYREMLVAWKNDDDDDDADNNNDYDDDNDENDERRI